MMRVHPVAHSDVEVVDLIHDVLDAVIVGLEGMMGVHFAIPLQVCWPPREDVDSRHGEGL